MYNEPFRRAILVVFSVPFTIGFDFDFLNAVWRLLQDFRKVPLKTIKSLRVQPIVFAQKINFLPVHDKLFWIQYVFTNWTQPGRRLFHDGVPRECLKALWVNTLVRPTGQLYSSVAQLK